MSLKDWMKKVEGAQLNEFATNGQIQIKPASQMPKTPGQQTPLGANNGTQSAVKPGQPGQPATNANTQVITQGNKTLGTVNNPQLAQQIKQSIGKGEMSLAGDQLGEDEMMEVAPPGMEKTVLALKKKFPGNPQRAFATAWSMYNKKHGKTEESMMESKQLNEGTLEEIIGNHPHEHKMCQEGWGMDNSLFEALADHYYKEGRIPRSVWHGSAEELREFVESCYAKDTMGSNEGAINSGMLDEEGVAEGFDKEAEAYKAHLLKTSPKMMDFLSKAVKGWRPSEDEMLAAIDTGYMVMKHTGDVKQAGKAMMDELNTLHRMSQGQQGVAEGLEEGFSIEDMVMDQWRNGSEVWQIASSMGMDEGEVQGIIDDSENGVSEGSKEDFTMNARQADPRLDKYATDPKKSFLDRAGSAVGGAMKKAGSAVMNKLHPSDDKLRSGPLEETSELEQMLRQSTKESAMYESKKSKKAVEEAVEKTKTGIKHKADAGGYGRKDDEADTDEDGKKIKKVAKDEPKKGRGRPKKTDNASGEDKKFDFSALSKTSGSKAPKTDKWDKKKTTTHKIATKADREEIDEGDAPKKRTKSEQNFVNAASKAIERNRKSGDDAARARLAAKGLDGAGKPIKKQGVAEGSLNEFAPDGFNGGDDDEGFSPEIAKMAQDDGFTKGAGLADGATLERAMAINYWHSQHGGMYKQYFAKGFKAGRMDKIRHNNKQYNLNLKLMKDGSIRHGQQGVAEGYPKHQDLSGISTDKLKAYLDKQSKQQVSGEGNQVKRVRAELQSREQDVAEGETIEKKGGRIHKGSYGTSHEAGDEGVKKAVTQRGRGRPKKDADDSGEVKNYDWSAFGAKKGVKLPAWDKKKTTTHKIATKADREEVDEAKLKGKQTKLDINKNGKVDGGDFALLRGQKKKDAQMESWDRQLKGLLTEGRQLNEGLTVSTSVGNEGGNDTVSITASDADAHQLLQMLQNAGMGSGVPHHAVQAATAPAQVLPKDTSASPALSGGNSGSATDDNVETPGNNVSSMPMPRGMAFSVQPEETEAPSAPEEFGTLDQEEVVSALGSEQGSADDSGDSALAAIKKLMGQHGASEVTAKEATPPESKAPAAETEVEESDEDGKKPDEDGDGVPDWADKKKNKDDNSDEDDESEDDEDGKEKVEEGAQTCNECGGLMEDDHSCGQINEWANSPVGQSADEQFESDMKFMQDVISAGLNGRKSTGQATTPVLASQTNRQMSEGYNIDVAAEMRKLAGIR